jgi:hypothetical protein
MEDAQTTENKNLVRIARETAAAREYDELLARIQRGVAAAKIKRAALEKEKAREFREAVDQLTEILLRAFMICYVGWLESYTDRSGEAFIFSLKDHVEMLVKAEEYTVPEPAKDFVAYCCHGKRCPGDRDSGSFQLALSNCLKRKIEEALGTVMGFNLSSEFAVRVNVFGIQEKDLGAKEPRAEA